MHVTNKQRTYGSLFTLACGLSAFWVTMAIVGGATVGSIVDQLYASMGIPEILVLNGVLFLVIAYLVKPNTED